MTLIEILVAASLFGILLYLFFAFLVPVMKFSSQGTARADIQQMAVLTLNSLEVDVQRSAQGALFLLPQDGAQPNDPVVLASIPMAEELNPDGRKRWEERLVVYYWDRTRERLFRKEWSATQTPPVSLSVSLDPTAPASLSQDDLRELATTTNGTERSVASGVTDFNVSHAGAGVNLEMPLEFTITIEHEVPQQSQSESFTLIKTLTTRSFL